MPSTPQTKLKSIFKLILQPGTYRDFSAYTAIGCPEMIWFRSYHRYLKKIGGYKSIGYIPRYVSGLTNNSSALKNTAIINGSGETFAQPSYPYIQNMQVDSIDAQDYEAPFHAEESLGAISDPIKNYQQFDPITSSLPARTTKLLNVLANNGGYGVVRKAINIIGDAKNVILSAGDAYPNKIGVGSYPVSGVAFSTNSLQDLRMPDFQSIDLPWSLPKSDSVIRPLTWKGSFNTTGNFSKITSDGFIYVALGADNIYWSDTGELAWNQGGDLPLQSYYALEKFGIWLAGAANGMYISQDAKVWQQSTGISIKVNAIYGTLAATNSGIYLTEDNGVSYTITSQTTGVFNCFSATSNIVVAGSNEGIYFSTDSKAWELSNIKNGNVVKIIYSGNFLYAIMSDAISGASVYKSGDGKTWEACKFEDTSNFTTPCTDIAFYQNIILLGTNIGLYYSQNGIGFYNATNQHKQAIANVIRMTAKSPDGGFLAATASGVISSMDGIVWFDTKITSNVNCVSYFSKWFVGQLDEGIYYSHTQLSLIQEAAPYVDGLYTPGEYVWNLDTINLTTGEATVASATYVVAHQSCGLTKSIDDQTDYPVYIRNMGELSANINVPLRWNETGEPLTEIKNWLIPMVEGQNINPQPTLNNPSGNVMNSTVKVSGGVCAVGPFLFAYGNEGLIRNSDVNNPSQWFSLTNAASVLRNSGLANDVNVGTSKVVKGLPFRGSGTLYAALFWSLDSLILATYVGAPAVFNYTILSNAVTIIAAHSAIEVYGSYYWIGDNRFYVFAGGAIQEVPNEINRNWFFNNINNQRQHIIWASVNPQYNEIWWFFPKGNSYECNHALIYNYADQTWYDTPIDRSAGFYAGIYRSPVWVSNTVDSSYYGYDYFLHEQGVDKVDFNGDISPISSSFTTPDIGYTSSSIPGSPKQPQGLLQNWLIASRLEPDGLIEGTWNLHVFGRTWVNEKNQSRPTKDWDGQPIEYYKFNSNTPHIDFREQWRIMFLQFSNSTIGGDWYVGNNMLTCELGDSEGF